MASSLTFNTLIRNAALRMNALVGAQFGALETTFSTVPLTAANFRSADWPFTAFKDAVLIAEETFVRAIAEVPNHPYRMFVGGGVVNVTAGLTNGAMVPNANSGGSPIVGVLGAVLDSSTVLTLKPIATVMRVRAETWRVVPLYYYAIENGRIFHTRTTVFIDVVTYDRAARLSAMNTSLTSPTMLPDALEEGLVALMLRILTKDTAFEAQAQYYGGIAAKALEEIRSMGAVAA